MAINWDAPIEIRDGRNGNWFWVDKEIWADPSLSASDKVIYGSLAYFANQKTQTLYPSLSQLENYSKISRRQVYRSTKKLEILKYILITRKRGKPNSYMLIDNGIKATRDKMSLGTNGNKGRDKLTLKVGTNIATNNNYITRNRYNREFVEEMDQKGSISYKEVG